MAREGETSWLNAIWWLVNFAPLTMVNGNCLHVSFFPDPALPETFSLIALATCCWSQCHFPSMNQFVSISPAWQVFLSRSYPASVSTCWHLDIWVALTLYHLQREWWQATLCDSVQARAYAQHYFTPHKSPLRSMSFYYQKSKSSEVFPASGWDKMKIPPGIFPSWINAEVCWLGH